jgi:hypothetical protein
MILGKQPINTTMDEGKNPNPRIYQQSEAGELIQEYSGSIEDVMDELQYGDPPTTEAITEKLTQLLAKMRSLKATLENDANTDTHAASISYNDAMWEFYQILKEKSHIRKQQQQGLSAISRSGMFPSSRTHDDDDNSSRSGGDDNDDDNSSRGGGDMDSQQAYDDDYWNNHHYSDSPRRGDYDHEEEAS